jgi:pyridoxal phosphate enzyme (YggS family)
MLSYKPIKMISEKIEAVRKRIKEAASRAGRDASDIVLLCVVKEASLDDATKAVDAGIADIGENRVKDAIAKYEILSKKAAVRWHFIGHLQTNKVKKAVKLFDLIHSIDSLHLAEEIQNQAEKIGKLQSVLIEVNVSGEATKYGMPPEKIEGLIKAIGGMRNLMLLGLMTMAPYTANPEDSRRHFRRLKELRDSLSSYNCENIDMRHLSMGMSGDFEVAVEEGADIVRIGSAIFK